MQPPLTLKQLAERSGRSVRTLHRLRQAGALVPLGKVNDATTGALLFDPDHPTVRRLLRSDPEVAA